MTRTDASADQPTQREPSASSTASTDSRLAAYLREDEHLLARKRSATVSVVEPVDPQRKTMLGRLFLTDRRLICLNGGIESIELADIRELGITRDRLLISLVDSRGVVINLEGPAAFRSRVAAAIRALRHN